MRRHRLHHIRHRQNPRLQENLLSRQTQRISRSVQPFMMLPHDPRHRPGKLDVLQDIIPRLRMRLDQAELHLRQLRRFAQDLRRQRDLPDVVEERRHPDSVEILIRKPHLHRDRPRQIRNPPLMAGGIGILRFDGQGQRFERCPHRPPQVDQRPVQVLLLLATVRERPLEVVGPLPDGQFQSRAVTVRR